MKQSLNIDLYITSDYIWIYSPTSNIWDNMIGWEGFPNDIMTHHSKTQQSTFFLIVTWALVQIKALPLSHWNPKWILRKADRTWKSSTFHPQDLQLECSWKGPPHPNHTPPLSASCYTALWCGSPLLQFVRACVFVCHFKYKELIGNVLSTCLLLLSCS